MKATQKTFARSAREAAAKARVFFFCGQDEAGATQAAQTIVSLLPDAGERVEISGADLRKDPVRLGDEARSTSLFGDTRHIWVRASGDEAHDAVANLLDGEGEAWPVLIVATGATDKARTAKLLASRPDALVAMFYPPEIGDFMATVRGYCDAHGLQASAAITERIARGAGMDARLALSEVEKLALYLDTSPQRPRTLDAAALDAIGAPTEDDGFQTLVDAVLGGQADRIGTELRRMQELGLNPVGTLLALERRAAQLAALAAKLGPRGDVAALVEAEANARRVFWKDKAALKMQLQRWRGPRLERLVNKLSGLHQALMAQSRDAELLLGQGLTEICRYASRPT